jgi:hypothetical protein
MTSMSFFRLSAPTRSTRFLTVSMSLKLMLSPRGAEAAFVGASRPNLLEMPRRWRYP